MSSPLEKLYCNYEKSDERLQAQQRLDIVIIY